MIIRQTFWSLAGALAGGLLAAAPASAQGGFAWQPTGIYGTVTQDPMTRSGSITVTTSQGTVLCPVWSVTNETTGVTEPASFWAMPAAVAALLSRPLTVPGLTAAQARAVGFYWIPGVGFVMGARGDVVVNALAAADGSGHAWLVARSAFKTGAEPTWLFVWHDSAGAPAILQNIVQWVPPERAAAIQAAQALNAPLFPPLPMRYPVVLTVPPNTTLGTLHYTVAAHVWADGYLSWALPTATASGYFIGVFWRGGGPVGQALSRWFSPAGRGDTWVLTGPPAP